MAYYSNLIIEKSWRFLQEVKKNYKFILIGGWAVYLYCKALKSKDIDIIVDYNELEKLRAQYNLVKNDRLKKYEIHAGEFDVDIYVPFYSELGIPSEDIIKSSVSISGFLAPPPEILLILKQKAFLEREGTTKGEKDKIDITALLNSGIDLKKYTEFLARYGLLNYKEHLGVLLKETRSVLELGLNEYAVSKLKTSLKF